MTDEVSPPAPSEGEPAPASPSVDLQAVGHEEAATGPKPPDVDAVGHDEAGPKPPDVNPVGDGEASAPSAAVAEPAEPAWRPNYVFLAVLSIVSLGLDLASKAWAKARLEDAKSFADRRIEVIHDTFAFIFAKNRGGAWGLLQDEPESIRRPFFLGISVLAIVFIVSLYRKLTPQQWALKWGLPLVLGGALGNLVNRIQYNYVVDFIDVSARWGGREHHWPTFNVADIAIVVGVGLMAVDMFTPRKSTKVVVVARTDEIPPLPPSSPASSSEPTPKET
jgi:signal peptidase II